MEKRFELGWLLDFYGPLLTGHRRELVRLYCDEDLSLSEIAEQLGISRQGVYDAVRKAEVQLKGYEQALGLLKRYRDMQTEIENCKAQLDQIEPASGSEAALRAAKDALRRIEGIER